LRDTTNSTARAIASVDTSIEENVGEDKLVIEIGWGSHNRGALVAVVSP
jgi:hypothetical protein